MYIVLNVYPPKIFSNLAKIVKRFKECSALLMDCRFFQEWPQTFVSTKSADLVILRVWPPSQTSVGIEQMDSKQEFFGPSDVQAHLHCAALTISSACKKGMTKVSFQLLVRRFGPDRSSDEKFSCHSRGQSVSDGGVTIDRSNVLDS